MQGEVMFALSAWETIRNGDVEGIEVPAVLGMWPLSAWLELDLSAYLDAMLPIAVDP